MGKLDRIARSTRHLLEIMDTLREAGARFRLLSEPWADTTTHAGKMIMTVFAGIAEFERKLIQERTTAGRIAAQQHGGRFGRPRKLNVKQEKLARRLNSRKFCQMSLWVAGSIWKKLQAGPPPSGAGV